MTHSELYNRFQNIQATKNNLKNELTNYILCTLKNNDGHICSPQDVVRLDYLKEDFPNKVKVADKDMHLMEVSVMKEKEIQVKVCEAVTGRIHTLCLETDKMENLESTAEFINRMLIHIGENNMYSLLVVFDINNSRKLFPKTLMDLEDSEAWNKLMALKPHEVKVYQLKGPRQKFMPFDQFIEQMNEIGVGNSYAIRLHLKEKFL